MNYKITYNVEKIMNKYRDYIKNDKHLILLYWKLIDGVEMDKNHISTRDFLHKSTCPEDIKNAKLLIQLATKIK